MLYKFEEGMPLMDVAVEMGRLGVNALKLNESPIYLMASYGPGNAIDPGTQERFRVVSFAYQTKSSPIHFILIGTPEKGWKVTSEDIHDVSKFEIFLDSLLQEGQSKPYRKSFEQTGLKKDMIQWSGRETITIPGIDISV